ncbi:MAG: metallophosphoesterase [Myxococcales bacterium]
MKVLHFSDPHVQLPRWRERPLRELGPLRALATVELWKGRGREYDDAFERLKAIVRDADALRVDLVICTGDFTQLAMEEEFALARDALAPLGGRLVSIAGNHDRYPIDGRPNRLYESYFPPKLLPDGIAALDSCGEVCWPVITRGRIEKRELDQDFANKIVLVHHAPVPDWPWHELRGRKALLEKTRDAAAVLCGHKHERFRRGNVFCAGSSTQRGHEGYWLLELDQGRIVSAEQRRP